MSDSLWPMNCNTSVFPAFTIVWSLLKLISIVSGMPSNHLICCPLLLLPSIFPSIRVFFKESALCNTWPKYCSFSFSPYKEYLGLIYLGLTHLVSLQSKGLSRIFSNTTVWQHINLVLRLLYGPTVTSIYDYWKNNSFDSTNLYWQSGFSAFEYAP